MNDIENQQTIEGLSSVSKRTNNLIGLLLKEGAKISNLSKIISEINDRLVRKVLELAERQFGQPPVPYCWVVLGSEGRKEQTFKTDQTMRSYTQIPLQMRRRLRLRDISLFLHLL